LKVRGKYENINLFYVLFKPTESKFPQEVSIETIESLQLSNGSYVKLHVPPPKPSGTITPEKLLELTEKWLDEQKEIKCKESSNLTAIFIPFRGDSYGITDDAANMYKKLCFKIINPNYKSLEYISNENIDLNTINDFQLREIGKNQNADLILYGHVYTVNVPFMYTADPSKSAPADMVLGNFFSNNNNDLENIITAASMGFARSFIQKEDALSKANYEELAGTWLYCTFYQINVKTGKKEYLYKNNKIRKL
jgi:hypothetical protein